MGRDVDGLSKWKEISGASDVGSCGCAVGAWADIFNQCQKCGSGIQCDGMGIVEVLPGYFARTDNAGFVWKCYGTDWRRCPGGVPGTCAERRVNSSIACEECEAFTRQTAGGSCEVRRGKDHYDWAYLLLLFSALVRCCFCSSFFIPLSLSLCLLNRAQT